MPLDDSSRVRSQIATVVRQIQRFDFDRNLVYTDTKSNNTNTVTSTRGEHISKNRIYKTVKLSHAEYCVLD